MRQFQEQQETYDSADEHGNGKEDADERPRRVRAGLVVEDQSVDRSEYSVAGVEKRNDRHRVGAHEGPVQTDNLRNSRDDEEQNSDDRDEVEELVVSFRKAHGS